MAATIPISAGVPGAAQIFGVVFLLVVVFTLIQGQSLAFAARRLRVTDDTALRDVTIDSAPLEAIDATMLQLTLSPASRLAGVSVRELRLPGDAVVTLVMRRGDLLVPDENTVLRSDDHVLLATSNAGRPAVERRLRAVSRRGRLARWRGEHGEAAETAGDEPSRHRAAGVPAGRHPNGWTRRLFRT